MSNKKIIGIALETSDIRQVNRTYTLPDNERGVNFSLRFDFESENQFGSPSLYVQITEDQFKLLKELDLEHVFQGDYNLDRNVFFKSLR